MHFLKSNIIRLITAVLASPAIASRPSSATPSVTLDAVEYSDVVIAERDVNHKLVNESIHITVKSSSWVDEHSLQENTPVLKVAYHDAADVEAKAKKNFAKRVAALVPTTKYDTKTLTTDVTDVTNKPKETLVESHQVKAKSNTGLQSQQIADSLVNARSVLVTNQSSSTHTHHGGTAKTTKTLAIGYIDNPIRTKVKNGTSEPSDLRVGKPTGKPDTSTRDPSIDSAAPAAHKSKPTSLEPSLVTSSAISAPTIPLSNTVIIVPSLSSSAPQPARSSQPTHIAGLRKRDPGTFEYIYDSTTILVTPTPPASPPLMSQAPRTGMKKLRFGVVALAPTISTKRVHT